MDDTENRSTDADTDNSRSTDQKIKVWKFELSLTFIKSIGGIFNIVNIVSSLLCLIILAAAKRVDCFAAFTSTYGFYNFAFSSCLITYIVRFIIYVFNLDTRLLWVFPWLIWNSGVSLFFALMFLIASIAVLANACGGYYGGYRAAGGFGIIAFFVMAAETVYNIFLLRRDHPPTDNKVLLMIGVERKPPGNSPVYDRDNSTNDDLEDPKY